MNPLSKALLDDAAELCVCAGEREQLFSICDLLRATLRAVRVDAKGLGQSCITLRDGALVGTLQLLGAFAA